MTPRRPSRTLLCHALAMALSCSGLPCARAAEADAACARDGAVELGRVMDQVHAHDLILLDAAAQEQRVAGILNRLQAQGPSPAPLRIFLFNDGDLNAFSGPDGALYVSGALLTTASDDELAFVLAHEIEHIAQCDHLREFNSTRSTRQVIVAGTAALAVVLAIVTLGAGAAAAGPMGTSTVASSNIINVGTMAVTNVISIPGRTGKVELVRPTLARSYIETEHGASPVYSPALFGTIVKLRYTGFGDEAEAKANARAQARATRAGYAVEPVPLAGLRTRAGPALVDHLRSTFGTEGAAK
jgi:hypothetical protein